MMLAWAKNETALWKGPRRDVHSEGTILAIAAYAANEEGYNCIKRGRIYRNGGLWLS